jgi:cytochrome c-type biogenesis protein CcsB
VINQTLSNYSAGIIVLALVAYFIAFMAYCAEWAFGSRSRFGAGIAQGKSVELGSLGAQAGAPAVERIAVTVTAGAGSDGATGGGSGGVTVLTRTSDDREQPTVAGSSMRAEIVGRFGIYASVIAFVFHFAGVILRGLAAHRVPWANMYEFSCSASLAMSGAYMVLLAMRKPVRWMGVPVTFIVLVTLGLARTVLYTQAEGLVPALDSYWLYIHVTAAMLSTGAYGVATVATVLYLFKAGAEEGKLPRLGPLLDRVPESAVLDRLAYRIIAFIFPLWTFAVIAGAIWAEKAWGKYWGWDPKETWSFIVWVVYAAYLHARATQGWKGKAAAWIAMAAFGCVLFNYFVVNTVLDGLHSYAGV